MESKILYEVKYTLQILMPENTEPLKAVWIGLLSPDAWCSPLSHLNHGQRLTHGNTTSPKTFASKIPGDKNDTLPFDKTSHGQNWQFRWLLVKICTW